jgi:hypothetical protein
MANWLDAIIAGYNTLEIDGTKVTTGEQRRTLNFTGGVSAVDDPVNGRINVSWGGAASLVSATDLGEVNALGAANTVLCSDGSTAGGSWRSYLAALSYVSFGAAPPSLGTQRWSHGTTVRGLDHAGTGEAQLMDWGDTIADHLTIGSNNANLDGVDIVAGATGEFDVRVGAATNLRVSATTVSTPANAIWSLGTGYVRHGASYATAGSIRLTDTDNVTWLNGGNNYALCSGQGTTAILGGPYPTRPTTAAVDAATTTELRVAGTALVSCTASAVAVGVKALTFGATLVTPTVGQADDATASVTCDNTIYGAQRATNAAGGASASRSGQACLVAPSAGGHADNYDGNCAIISAPPANLSTLGAEKCCFFGKAVAAPTLAPTNGHIIYVDPTTENLMALGESNTLTTLALK